MNISRTSQPGINTGQSKPPAQTPKQPPTETVEVIKDEFQTHAAIHNSGRQVGNKLSSAFTGVVGHVGGNVALIPSTVAETYKNLWKAETIGPYAKSVGSVVALAGIPLVAGAALAASPFMGVAEAFKEREAEDYPLVSGSTAEVADRITSDKNGADVMLARAIDNMQEFGDEKLAPGEEPWDIPLDKIFKGALDGLNFLMVKVPVEVSKAVWRGAKATYRVGKTAVVETAKGVKKYGPKLVMAAAAGVTSTLIAGPAGLVIGVGVSAIMAGRDIKNAFTDEDRSFGSRVGGIAKTLAYIPVGPVMAGMAVKENFGRSFVEGWQGEPIEAIKTTGKAVMAQAKEALNPSNGGEE